MAITKDATKGWARPLAASAAAEWTELLAGTGIANPDHWYDCRIAAGNHADGIGAISLTAVGALTYSSVPSGWAGGGITATDGVAARLAMPLGTGPDPDTTSQVWLVVVHSNGAPGTNRAAFGINVASSANSYRALFLTTGVLRGAFAGANVDGAINHPAGDYVLVMRYDRATSVAKVYSDLETITNVYSATTLADNPKGIGSAAWPGGVTFMGVATWTGANAETLTDASIATIRSRIQSPPSGASVVAGPCVVSGGGSVVVAACTRGTSAGALAIAGGGADVIAASTRGTFTGALTETGAGSDVIAASTRGTRTGALTITGAGSDVVAASTRGTSAGALTETGGGLVVVAGTTRGTFSGSLIITGGGADVVAGSSRDAFAGLVAVSGESTVQVIRTALATSTVLHVDGGGSVVIAEVTVSENDVAPGVHWNQIDVVNRLDARAIAGVMIGPQYIRTAYRRR